MTTIRSRWKRAALLFCVLLTLSPTASIAGEVQGVLMPDSPPPGQPQLIGDPVDGGGGITRMPVAPEVVVGSLAFWDAKFVLYLSQLDSPVWRVDLLPRPSIRRLTGRSVRTARR